MSGFIILVTAVNENEEYNQGEYAFDYQEDFEDQDSIQICCAWGEEIKDGILTYTIDDEDSEFRQAVYKSIQEWDTKIEGLLFQEVFNRRNADVEIYFREDGGQEAGETRNHFDRHGFLTKSYVIISEGTYGLGFDADQIEQIAKHEIGHVLGLGHASFDGSLMRSEVTHGSGEISDCEISAVSEANHWKLEEDSNFPNYPKEEYVKCNA